MSYAAQHWPTPRSSPNENGTHKRTPSQIAGKHGLYLSSEVNEQAVERGYLNHDWVEQLMALPQGWTRIDGLHDQDKSSKTGKRRVSSRKEPKDTPTG